MPKSLLVKFEPPKLLRLANKKLERRLRIIPFLQKDDTFLGIQEATTNRQLALQRPCFEAGCEC